jgi:hypothetical protein
VLRADANTRYSDIVMSESAEKSLKKQNKEA